MKRFLKIIEAAGNLPPHVTAMISQVALGIAIALLAMKL